MTALRLIIFIIVAPTLAVVLMSTKLAISMGFDDFTNVTGSVALAALLAIPVAIFGSKLVAKKD